MTLAISINISTFLIFIDHFHFKFFFCYLQEHKIIQNYDISILNIIVKVNDQHFSQTIYYIYHI